VLAQEAIDWIAQLYAIKSAADEQKLGFDELHALRHERAPAILAGFKEWLDVRQTQVLPQSGLGKAISYALGQWEALNRFLEDGRLELDNNRSERALRAVAVGRKNWMFFGNERGGQTGAVFYSLIATCKARGIDPKVYIHEGVLRLAEGEDPKTLTPREWQAREVLWRMLVCYGVGHLSSSFLFRKELLCDRVQVACSDGPWLYARWDCCVQCAGPSSQVAIYDAARGPND